MNIKMQKTREKLIVKLNRYRELKKQRGMTLLEIIIVLGIIGTIAAGVVVLAQRAYDSKAMTDLITNVNSVRTAIKETYGPSGVYPDEKIAQTIALTDGTIGTVANNTDIPPIAQLVQLGKLSMNEAKNNISGNFVNIGNGHVGTGGANKAFFVELNGLDMKQCRNVMLQIGNQWDYVRVFNSGATTGHYVSPDHLDFQVTVAAGGAHLQGVVRSLASNRLITPAIANGFCSDTAANSIVLGSR